MSTARRRLSLAIVIASASTLILATGARLLADASLWRDEAAIAYNMISMSGVELLGRLDSGHQFPRLYLAAVNQLRHAFGYQTIVLRALPFAFFVLGVGLWHALLWRRFRARPALLLLAVALTAVPGQWLAYGAMFKQYSLDVFVALLPFLLTDDTLDRRWRQGRGAPWLLLWMLPVLVSYSYGIALLGRGVGHWLGRLRRQGVRVPLRATAWLAGGFLLAFGATILVDLRHAMRDNVAFGFWEWRGCIATGDPVEDAALLGRFCVDWLRGGRPFGGGTAVAPASLVVLVAAAVVGAVRALVTAVRGGYEGGPPTASSPVAVEVATGGRRFAVGPAGAGAVGEAADARAWGTRSLSALVTLGGLFAAGLLLSYPLCANRLTLFAFFSLVLLVLEGVSWLAAQAERWLEWRWLELLPALLALGVGPSAVATVAHVARDDPPENVRPLLPIIASVPERPVVVGRCSRKQLLTLPEWIDRDDVLYVDQTIAEGGALLPELEEFWLLTAGGYSLCPGWTDRLREAATLFRPASTPEHTASLHHVRLPAGATGSPRDPDPAGD